MSIAELRLPRDPSYKRFVKNPEFVRHLLPARPMEDLDEAESSKSRRPAAISSTRTCPSAWSTLRGS